MNHCLSKFSVCVTAMTPSRHTRVRLSETDGLAARVVEPAAGFEVALSRSHQCVVILT